MRTWKVLVAVVATAILTLMAVPAGADEGDGEVDSPDTTEATSTTEAEATSTTSEATTTSTTAAEATTTTEAEVTTTMAEATTTTAEVTTTTEAEVTTTTAEATTTTEVTTTTAEVTTTTAEVTTTTAAETTTTAAPTTAAPTTAAPTTAAPTTAAPTTAAPTTAAPTTAAPTTTAPAAPRAALDLNVQVGTQVSDPGNSVLITGADLEPGSPYNVIVRSTPRMIGSGTVGADGTFSQRLALPAGLEPGRHSVTLTVFQPTLGTHVSQGWLDVSESGRVLATHVSDPGAAGASTTTTPAIRSTPNSLAYTGTSTGAFAFAALTSTLTGVALMMLRRRRELS